MLFKTDDDSDHISQALRKWKHQQATITCAYCDKFPCSNWCTRFGMKDSTVTLDKKPLDIAFKKLDNDLLRRPLKTYSLLLDALND